MYTLYKDMLTIKNYHRLSSDQADIAIMSLKETLPGFLDQQGSVGSDKKTHQDAWIAHFLETADLVLAAHKVQADLAANFMILSTNTARSIQTTQIAESVPPLESIDTINKFMRKATGDDELLLSLRPVSLRQFQGINIIPLAPYNTDEGITNVMEEVGTFGLFHYIHLPHWEARSVHKNTELQFRSYCRQVKVDIPDYVSRSVKTLILSNPEIPEQSTYIGDPTKAFKADESRVNPFKAINKSMIKAFRNTPKGIDLEITASKAFYASLMRFIQYDVAATVNSVQQEGRDFINRVLVYYNKFYHMLEPYSETRNLGNDKYHMFTRIKDIEMFEKKYELLLNLKRSVDGTMDAPTTFDFVSRAADVHRLRATFELDHLIRGRATAAAAADQQNLASTAFNEEEITLIQSAIGYRKTRIDARINDVAANGTTTYFVKGNGDAAQQAAAANKTSSNAERVTINEQLRQFILDHLYDANCPLYGCDTVGAGTSNVYTFTATCFIDSNVTTGSNILLSGPISDTASFEYILDVLRIIELSETNRPPKIYVPSVKVECKLPSYSNAKDKKIRETLFTEPTKASETHPTAHINTARQAISGSVTAAKPTNTEKTAELTSTSSETFTIPIDADYSSLIIVRPKVVLATETIFYGIGGKVTGVTALGQERYEEAKRYTEQDEQFRVKMRMAVCLAHPEHIIRLPHAKFRRYISGGSATLMDSDPFELDPAKFTASHRKRGSTPGKDMMIMATPKITTDAFAFSANPARDTHKYPRASGLTNHYFHFSTLNDRLFPGFHVGAPYSEKISTFNHSDTRAVDQTSVSSYILVGNGMILCNESGAALNTANAKAFAKAGHTFDWTAAAVPLLPVPAQVLCWRAAVNSVEIYNGLPDQTAKVLQANGSQLAAVTTGVNEDYTKKTQEYNKTMGIHCVEAVSRGPFRSLTEKNAMDVWNGRGAMM